ncbi:MAG: prolipoprotein diacylglyceryl transferase [Chloroflexi bacterium]|nr:prolipoprotein diacylglyceryl transferase [Chloroflexota bacterium]
MIDIGINPIAISLGSLSVRWYSIMTALAILTVVAWTVRAAVKMKFSKDFVYTAGVWAIVGGILGARLVHVIDQLDYYTVHPGEIFSFEGLAIYGAILGATLAVWIASMVHKFQFAALADMAAPGILLGQAVGRVGCTINGCCYGQPTTLPWGLVYTNPNTYAPRGIPTEPAVVYEMLYDLLLFGVVWKLQGKLKPSGSVFLVYLALYSIGRFFIASTRDPGSQGTLLGGWLMQAQIIALLVTMVTIPVLVARTRWVKHGGDLLDNPGADSARGNA